MKLGELILDFRVDVEVGLEIQFQRSKKIEKGP